MARHLTAVAARDTDLVNVATVILTAGRAVAAGLTLAGQAADDMVLSRRLSRLDDRDLYAASIYAATHDDAWLDNVISGELDLRGLDAA